MGWRDGTPVAEGGTPAWMAGTPVSEAAPTMMQRVQASAPARVAQGLRDPIDAGAQILSRVVPEGLTRFIDKPFAAMRNSDSPLLQTIGETLFADPTAWATDARLRETEAQYQQARQATARGGDPGFDAARFAGQVFSPVNATIGARLPAAATATVPRMAATGAGLGALGGGLTTVTDERDQQNFAGTKASQMGLGAITGAVLTPAIGATLQAAAPYVNRAIDRLTGKTELTLARASLETDRIIAQTLKDMGQRADDLPQQQLAMLRQQVNESLRSGKKLDAAAAMRKTDFEAEGLPFTRGQITRDPILFAREKNVSNVSGVGDPLMARLTEQSQGLQKRIGGLSAGAAEEQQAGAQITGALRGMDEAARRQVRTAYRTARESAGKDLDVPLQGLAQEVERIARDYGKGNQAVQWARNYFKDTGIFGGTQRRVFSIEDAEQALQTINKNASNDPGVKNAFGEVAKAIKQAITSADDAGGVFAVPRNLAKKRFDAQDAVKALGDVVDGSAPVDKFVNRYIINGETRQTQALAKVLRENAPEAFAQARAQLGAYIQRSAFGENLAGDKSAAPEKLGRALRSIGTGKLSAFYDDAEIATMKRLARIVAYIESAPANSKPNTSGTGAMLMNVGGMITGVSPMIQLGRAIAQPIANQRSVNAALAANVPEVAAQLSPEAVRRAGLAAALSGIVGGQAVAPR